MVIALSAAAGFAAGALISFVNYCLLRRALNKGGLSLQAVSLVRTLLSAAVLAAAYLLGKNTELPLNALLIGTALGLTVSLTLFTFLLTRRHNADTQNSREPEQEKDADGKE